jgi:hypothetical protein
MSNIHTFQYVLPKQNLIQMNLRPKTAKEYQRIFVKPSIIRPVSVGNRAVFTPAFNKDFIPNSLTVPRSNQIKSVSIVNPPQVQTVKNIMPLNNKLTVPNLNLAQRIIPQGSIMVNGNLTQRVNNPLITNNNILNHQPVLSNNLKPVSIVSVGNNLNQVNSFNFGNIKPANQITSITPVNNFVPIVRPIAQIQPQNPNIIRVNPPMAINPMVPYSNSFLNPGEQLNLKEYELLGEIGKGSFGKIYKVRWKVNQKFYALKIEILDEMEGINQRLGRGKAMRNFVQSTGCQGVVNIYGSYLIKQGNVYHYFELMDLCETDFEKEIKIRSSYGSYFTEGELDNIIKQLISTLSFLQKQHITHRDIKPQNILIANGRYKLCDFGDIRVMKRGGLVVQRIRGSELYMSPILFYGLRKGFQAIEHNTYKSDVFSLGMCLFYAACLSFDGPVEIREVNDMNMKLQILKKYMGARYSPKLIKIFHLMLQNEESARPDFILLEDAIIRYGL